MYELNFDMICPFYVTYVELYRIDQFEMFRFLFRATFVKNNEWIIKMLPIDKMTNKSNDIWKNDK